MIPEVDGAGESCRVDAAFASGGQGTCAVRGGVVGGIHEPLDCSVLSGFSVDDVEARIGNNHL
jgi:hypothetical protein